MTPLYFGKSPRRLFGLYHASATEHSMASGVVVCPPIGQEYMRTHRALRQLASRLATSGHHVLRFDYFGTGDSAGDPRDAGTVQWLADVASAIDELREMAAVQAVTLVGLRLGAALAATCGCERKDVSRIVMWDPVCGEAFLRQMRDQEDPRDAAGEDVVGVSGFPLTDGMRAQIAGLDLGALTWSGKRVSMIASSESPRYQLLRQQISAQTDVLFKHVRSGGNWTDMDRLGAALLPQAIIGEIDAQLAI